MDARCAECQAATTWDDSVGSAICLQCGTLVDPSQSVLASHLDTEDTGKQYNLLWNPSSASTLKSFRSRNNWDLAGQGKEARDRKNSYAMHQFIKGIASSLSVSGLSPRAITLFSQAMSKGQYRWGRKAKLTAGVSLAIALREAHKPDSLRDIAFLLEESSTSLSHAFSSVVSLLCLSLPPADPAQHLPALQSHLSTLLHPPQVQSTLSTPLLALLTPLSLQTVIHTAASLSALLIRLGPSLPINSLSTPPTACAIILLCLESELRTSLPNLGDLAHLLAQRFGISKGVVMGRYKIIEDLVEEWVRDVPWLDQFGGMMKGKPLGCKRSKISKRVVVAKGLKDVVQFQEEIWRKKLEGLERPMVELEVDDVEEREWESATTFSTRSQTGSPEHGPTLRKKRKTRHTVDKAAQFLLDPLSTPVPSPPMSPPNALSYRSNTPPPLPLATYLLAASPSSLLTPPTRLQLLALERGGGEICDDELFEEGELDGLIRKQEEVEVLKTILAYNTDEEDIEEKEPKEAASSARDGTSRVDMIAFRRALSGTFEDIDLDGFEDVKADKQGGSHAELVEVEEWRPISPGPGCRGNYEDRYDEEC